MDAEEPCKFGECDHQLLPIQQHRLACLKEEFRLALTHHGSPNGGLSCFEFVCGDEHRYALVGHNQWTHKLQCEIFVLRRIGDHDRFELHIERATEGDEFLSRPGWPLIRSESMFFLHMVKHSSEPWDLYVLEAVPDQCVSFTVEKRNLVDVDKMRVEETKRLERLLAARMIKTLTAVPEKKTWTSGRGKSRGKGRGKGCGKGKGKKRGGKSWRSLSETEDEDADADADALAWLEAGHEQWGQDGGEHGEGSGDENTGDGDGEDGGDVEESAGGDGGPASDGVGGEAENGDPDGGPPPPPPPPPPPFPAGARDGTHRDRKRGAETMAQPYGSGKWKLADLLVGGIGGNCGCHTDTGSAAECKKNVTIGRSGLSLDVLRLRMKRWLVAGIDDAAWDSGKKKTHHVGMGGKFLKEFAEGLTEAQCDQIAATRPPPPSASGVLE